MLECNSDQLELHCTWLRGFYHHVSSSLVGLPVLSINWRWNSCSPRGSHQPFHLPLKNFRNSPGAVPRVCLSFDKNTAFCSMVDWTCHTPQSRSCKSMKAAHILVLLEVRILLRVKPLKLSKAGAFPSVLEMPEWLQCSVVFIIAFRCLCCM